MEISKQEMETGIPDLAGVGEGEVVRLKLKCGYAYHDPSGTILRRDLPDAEGNAAVYVQTNGGAAIRVEKDSPFIEVSARAVRGQEHKFERPSREEAEKLRGRKPRSMSPPAAAMLGLSMGDKDAGPAPEDKEIRGKETR